MLTSSLFILNVGKFDLNITTVDLFLKNELYHNGKVNATGLRY